MTSRTLCILYILSQIYITLSVDIIEHCTDIHILPHDSPENAIRSTYQCFHATRKFEIPFSKIADALLGPITGLLETQNKYEKMQARITEEDFDSRRKLRDIQKAFVQIFFALETKIHQVELPQLYHATLEHIFFKVGHFLEYVNETSSYIMDEKASINRYKQRIEDMRSNVTKLNILRENRTDAREHFEISLKEFRSKIHKEYDQLVLEKSN
jgi:hypothetical protein